MQMKSLAIVAATVMTVGAAQAADLNKPAKVAVDYVKVCDAYGAGFFYIPGSDTCLKISGFARLDIATGGGTTNVFGGVGFNNSANRRGSNTFSDNARADVQLDARTNTQYGLLRSFIDFHSNLGTSSTNSAVTFVELDHAFVQWGGLTAGRTTSKYNFADGEQNNQEYRFEAFTDNSVNLLAYTFAFGNGVTATLSLEDPTTGGYQATSSTAPANASTRRYQAGGSTFQYGALNLPDFVGNINVTQAWGEAQLSAVAHQVYGSAFSPATKEGYAFQAGILFNVPQLGAGDTIAFTGAYGSGAVGFVESYSPSNNDVGQDAVYNFTPGAGLKLSRSWTIGSSIVHNFSPMVALDIAPSYFNWQNSGMNMSETLFSAALDIKPVKGLLIKPDFEYRYSSLNNAAKVNSGNTSGSAYVFGVRVQRSF